MILSSQEMTTLFIQERRVRLFQFIHNLSWMEIVGDCCDLKSEPSSSSSWSQLEKVSVVYLFYLALRVPEHCWYFSFVAVECLKKMKMKKL